MFSAKIFTECLSIAHRGSCLGKEAGGQDGHLPALSQPCCSFGLVTRLRLGKNPPPAVIPRVDDVALAEGVPQPRQANVADILCYNALQFPPLPMKIQAWMVLRGLITPTVPESMSIRGELEDDTQISSDCPSEANPALPPT